MTNLEAEERLLNRYMVTSMCLNAEEARSENEALDLAISALREKEKEPCWVCNGSKLPITNTKCPTAYILGNTMFCGANGFSKVNSVKINYCPMCGRPLKGESDG